MTKRLVGLIAPSPPHVLKFRSSRRGLRKKQGRGRATVFSPRFFGSERSWPARPSPASFRDICEHVSRIRRGIRFVNPANPVSRLPVLARGQARESEFRT